jgi:hypothetical protein
MKSTKKKNEKVKFEKYPLFHDFKFAFTELMMPVKINHKLNMRMAKNGYIIYKLKCVSDFLLKQINLLGAGSLPVAARWFFAGWQRLCT